MRHFKRICFFCYSCALFAGGFWCSLEMEAFFYPGRGASPKADESSGFLPAAPDLTSGKEAERASSSSAVKKESGGQKDPAFCLIVEDNRVNAYERETGDLYLQTGVDARTLPCRLRRRILSGYGQVSADSLEKFLVSYAEA